MSEHHIHPNPADYTYAVWVNDGRCGEWSLYCFDTADGAREFMIQPDVEVEDCAKRRNGNRFVGSPPLRVSHAWEEWAP